MGIPTLADIFGGRDIKTNHDANWLKEGFEPAFSQIQQGTMTAADHLRSGYESLFQQRAQGLIGGFGEMSSRLGAQGASQGLSQDVLSRMLFAPGQELQANLGAASGEASSGLQFDLAKLFKGTSSEMAGLTRDQLAVMSNYLSALKGARAQQVAGGYSMLGSMMGGAIGAG